jgi:cytoskeletal protein RodZ
LDQTPLHWSEKAKMYPAPPPTGGTKPRPEKPQRPSRPPQAPREKRPRGGPGKGFWVTIAVVVLLAAVAGVVWFWYLPTRDKADEVKTTVTATASAPSTTSTTSTTLASSPDDQAAQDLVRRAMAVMQGAYLETHTFAPEIMTPKMLARVDRTVTYIAWPDATASSAATARAAKGAVNYAGTSINYAVGTVSATGRVFGVIVNIEGLGQTWYYIDGVEANWNVAPGATTTTTVATGQ